MALVPVAGRLEPHDGSGGRVADEILDEVHLGAADPDRGIRADAQHGSLVRCGLDGEPHIVGGLLIVQPHDRPVLCQSVEDGAAFAGPDASRVVGSYHWTVGQSTPNARFNCAVSGCQVDSHHLSASRASNRATSSAFQRIVNRRPRSWTRSRSLRSGLNQLSGAYAARRGSSGLIQSVVPCRRMTFGRETG